MRRRPGCAWRSTRSPWRSTRSAAPWSVEIEQVALAKETDAASVERLDGSTTSWRSIEQRGRDAGALDEREGGHRSDPVELKKQIDELRVRPRALVRPGEGQRDQLRARSRARAPGRGGQRALESPGQRPHAQGGGRRRGRRRDRLQLDGVPVCRLMEGEMAKLVRMEDVLHERVIGQDEAVAAVAMPSAAPARPLRPPPAHRLLPVPRSDRRRQDRAGAPWRTSCSTMSGP